MMKTWLIRREVRIPVSSLMTSARSSSVWRLPFIRASASPERTISTALAPMLAYTLKVAVHSRWEINHG
jgi:hypothetical protein